MPAPSARLHTYRLGFRPLDDTMSSADLVRLVTRALLVLDDPTRKVTIHSISRPPQHDAGGMYLAALTSGPEHWYLDHDDELVSMGLRCEVLP